MRNVHGLNEVFLIHIGHLGFFQSLLLLNLESSFHTVK